MRTEDFDFGGGWKGILIDLGLLLHVILALLPTTPKGSQSRDDWR